MAKDRHHDASNGQQGPGCEPVLIPIGAEGPASMKKNPVTGAHLRSAVRDSAVHLSRLMRCRRCRFRCGFSAMRSGGSLLRAPSRARRKQVVARRFGNHRDAGMRDSPFDGYGEKLGRDFQS